MSATAVARASLLCRALAKPATAPTMESRSKNATAGTTCITTGNPRKSNERLKDEKNVREVQAVS